MKVAKDVAATSCQLVETRHGVETPFTTSRLLVATMFAFVFLPAVGHADYKALVTRRCLDCHDNETRKGDLSLEALGFEIDKTNEKQWLRALEQIERGTMPPPKKRQPSPVERRAAVLDLETKLVAHQQKFAAPKPAMLRRLNRTEYRATIRDLLRLNMSSFDPTREFPDDNRSHGFPSDGEKLVTSSFLLRQYLESAEEIVERAIHFEPKPEVRRWDLLPPFDRTTKYQTYGEAAYFRRQKIQQPYQTISERMRGLPKGGYHPVDEMRDGVPVGGWYRIRIQAEAKFRYADLDPTKFHFPSEWDATEPIRLSLFTGTLEGLDPENKEALDTAATGQQSGERLLGTWDLPDDKLVWLECRVWLDGENFPRLGFPNGPSDSNYRLLKYFKENKHVLLNEEQLANFEADAALAGDWNVYMFFESPRIRVYKIEVEGPLNDIWPPASHRVVFGEGSYESKDAEKIILPFASRAWRRPAEPQEVAPLVKLVHEAEQAGLTPEVAVQEGLKAILCSPEFLYREEKGDALTGYEIASRLSYFLWSSMPDEQLLKLATAGELSRSERLRQEAERLLNDSRSDAFVNEFLDGWLHLHKLGTMAPDVHRFSVYYRDDLEPAMKTETRLFFRQLLNTNGSTENFLNSDYTFLNKELAHLYGVDDKLVAAGQGAKVEGLRPQDLQQDVDGSAPSLAFARVKLTDVRRGGLLGQASVLTLTANGVDTSPVTRGVWLLENILGAPPPPPPPNVASLEPDIRGTTTIRDQLQKHREAPSCRSCHQYIDPPGFALENFDPIGHWRGHYPISETPPQIDASGKLGAAEFSDVIGFKAALMQHRDQFARCIVEKLLIHALGRELEVIDRPYVRKIVDTAAKDGYRLRDLVLLSVESEIFKRK
ncbi:MAG: DUF1592 domain-containing protein [Planctomycetota bacterium]|nr:DUF1592 domain-containing protein [Planctomycetota bacterium]